MKLYLVNDDPTDYAYFDERWFVAVWADTPDDALLLAAGQYDGPMDAPFREMLEAREAPNQDRLAKHVPPWPCITHEPIVLRLAGMRFDDEVACDACRLAAMGMKQHAVCEECGHCRDCGCVCEEEAAAELPGTKGGVA